MSTIYQCEKCINQLFFPNHKLANKTNEILFCWICEQETLHSNNTEFDIEFTKIETSANPNNQQRLFTYKYIFTIDTLELNKINNHSKKDFIYTLDYCKNKDGKRFGKLHSVRKNNDLIYFVNHNNDSNKSCFLISDEQAIANYRQQTRTFSAFTGFSKLTDCLTAIATINNR